MSRKTASSVNIPADPGHLSAYIRTEIPALAAVTISGIIYNIGLAVCPWLEGVLVQNLADILSSSEEFASVLLPFAAYLATVGVVQLFRAVKRLYVRKYANNTVLKFKTILYKTILHSRPCDTVAVGDEISRATGDAEICAEGIRKVITEVFDTGVALVSYAVLLFIYDPLLAPVALIFPPLAALIAEKLKKPVTDSASKCRKSAASLSDATLDRVGNAVSYRINGLEKVQDEKYSAKLGDYEKKNIISGLWANGMLPVYNIVALLGAIPVIYFGGRNVLGAGHTAWDLAAFTAFFSCYVKLATKASKTSKLFNSIQKAEVSWKRIKPRLQSFQDPGDVLPAEPAEVRAEGLSFTATNGKKILDNVSFVIKPGQIAGVTGEVASGKSVLGKAFLGEYACEGKLTFGGEDLSGLILREDRRYVSYLGHTPELFDGTAEDNILLGESGDAMKYAELCCIDGEFSSFPDGIKTRIGEKGVRLSGGQQARTALARTLAHPAPVYVLDDPFSAVDMKTEQKIFENLRAYCKDSAVLLISHRLSLFDRLDGVIYMKDGTAVFDTHENMLKREPGYAALYTAQTESGEETQS